MTTMKVRVDGEWVTIGGASMAQPGLLAIKQYDPTVKVDYAATGTFADVDATNLAVTFTVPSSGSVIVRLSGYMVAAAATALSWGVRDGTTDLNDRVVRYDNANAVEGPAVASFLITGLTPGQVKTYKWSHARTVGAGAVTTQAGGIQGPAVMEVWDAQTGAGVMVPPYPKHKRVAANGNALSVNTASAWANLSTYIAAITDVTIPALVGDVLELSMSGLWGNEAGTGKLDVATIVSGTVTKLASSGTGTPGTEGIRGWIGFASTWTPIQGGRFLYTVQSGDVVAGAVTLRPRIWTSGARSIYMDPGQFVVVNLGPPAT